MNWTANQIIRAMREAYTLASAHRVQTAVVVAGTGLKAVLRPSPGDTVVIRDITPPCLGADINDAARQALHEFEDARPALERVIDIIDKDGRGKPRHPDFRTEVFAAMIEQFQIEQEAVTKGRYPEERPSLWTRLSRLR